MKKLVAFALAAGMTLGAVSTANAAEGCGRGFQRGYHGRCVPMRGYGPGYGRGRDRVVVAPGGLIVGNFYQGRGYWDGRRYYQHRERFNNGWRYR
jgi:hypothetical protein